VVGVTQASAVRPRPHRERLRRGRRGSADARRHGPAAVGPGESYCLAHHLSIGEDGQRTMMIASIRYLDEFVKQDGQWLFAERRLMVNWTETRPSTP
jgi:hypothetical protein